MDPPREGSCQTCGALKKVPSLHTGLRHGVDSSGKQDLISPMLPRDGALLSSDSKSEKRHPHDEHCLETPRSPKEGADLHMDSNCRITPKGTQPQPKQKDAVQQSLEFKSESSAFVLSADANPYTPQPSNTKPLQGLHAKTDLCMGTDPSGLGFIRAFPSGAVHSREEEYSQQGLGETAACAAGGTRPVAPLDLGGAQQPSRVAASDVHSVSFGMRKGAGNLTPLPTSSAPSLKFCKFLIGEDVAGFLVGRKGVGIEEFQARNGPGLKVSVSKRGELFPCLLERTATAVGVGDGLARAVVEVSRVALDRAMHKEEERRIDNGKKICKPKGCFKLVLPDTALVHLFTPDSEGRVPVAEVGKKHGVEILSSAQGGYLHKKLHHLGLKETVLQIIGTADAVPGAAVDLTSLYQGDPSLPSCLHLTYAHANFAATPPPPPTPPPSPALSMSCGPRLTPHFAHPEAVLQFASGQQQFLNSNTWSPRPQSAPLIHGFRTSAGSQTSMLCFPSNLGSTDSTTAVQVPRHELMVPVQRHGIQRSPYLLKGPQGSRPGFKENMNENIFPLTNEYLISELQQNIEAAATAPPPSPSLGWQQQMHGLEQQHHQHQRILPGGPAGEWADLQLLTQLCMPHLQQAGLQHENQQVGTHTQNLQQSLLQQLEELEQTLQQQQREQQKQPPQITCTLPEDCSTSSSHVQQLQQLQNQLQLLQLQQRTCQQQLRNGTSLADNGQLDEQQKILALSQQLQQQQMQMQQTKLLQQLEQQNRHRQRLEFPHHENAHYMAALASEQHVPVACPQAGLDCLPHHDAPSRFQVASTTLNNLKRLDAAFLQAHPHEIAQGSQPLLPIPPSQWTQFHHPQQPTQREWRAFPDQCCPSATAQGVALHAASKHLDAALNIHPNVPGPKMSPSCLVPPASVQSTQTSLASLAQQKGEQIDPVSVRKLLEELIRIIAPDTPMNTSNVQGQAEQYVTGAQTPARPPPELWPSGATQRTPQKGETRIHEKGLVMGVGSALVTELPSLRQCKQQHYHQNQDRRRRGVVSSTKTAETRTSQRSTTAKPTDSQQHIIAKS